MIETTNALYVDPSVLTYAITAIASVAVSIGAVVVIMWRKTKKKVAEKLNLEDRSIKETEGAVELIEETED
ncbi:MAG: hypothetical protein IKJ83_02060 [Ruminococcus sp.]|nr:hypothetical protein [Ruminococcus sp.]